MSGGATRPRLGAADDRRRSFALVRLLLLADWRDKRALFQRAMPIVFIVGGMAFFALTSLGGDSERRDLRRVGVADGVVLDEDLQRRLDEAGVEPVPTAGPAAAVADGSVEAAIVVTDGHRTVLRRPDDPAADESARRALVALGEEVPALAGSPVTTVEVEATTSKTRRNLGLGVATVLLFLLTFPLGAVSQRFRIEHRSGRLAHHLAVPLSRRQLLLAMAASEAVLGTLAVSPIVLLLGVGAVAIVAIDLGAAAAALTVVVLLAAVVATITTTALAGLVVAARLPARSEGEFLTFAPLVVALALGLLYGVVDQDVPTVVSMFPVIGLLDAIRAVLVDALEPLRLLGALGTTAVACAGLLRAAVAATGTDDIGTRAR